MCTKQIFDDNDGNVRVVLTGSCLLIRFYLSGEEMYKYFKLELPATADKCLSLTKAELQQTNYFSKNFDPIYLLTKDEIIVATQDSKILIDRQTGREINKDHPWELVERE